MTRRSRLASALLFACACQEPDSIAQTIVWIDAKPAAREALSRIKVHAVGPDDYREPSIEADDPTWPIKLVFVPKDADPNRRFALTIDARDATDTRLAILRLRTGFVPNQTRYAALMIHEECVERASSSCGVEEPCHTWSGELSAKQLSARSNAPRTLDVICELGGDGEPMPDDEPRPMTDRTAPQAGSEVPQAGSGPAVGGAGVSGGTPARPAVDPTGMCPDGFRHANGACMDFDECANENPCRERGTCKNHDGGFSCECEPGYAHEADGCVDIDECQTDNGGCETGCVDADGHYACECDGETWLRGDRKACGSFGTAQRVGFISSTQPMQPRFAFDANGNGLAVWLQSDATRTYLWTRRYTAASGWSGFPNRVPTGDIGNASSPRVALDPSGRGVITWLQSVDARTDLWAARYTGEGLEAGQTIETDDANSAFDPSIALDGDGDGLAVWTQSDGTHTRIRVNRFDAETGWSEAYPIQSSMTDEALTPRLALDRHGNAAVGWTQYFTSDTEGVRIAPWTARYDAALGRWRPPAVLDDSALGGVPDTQLFEPLGHSVTVWSRASEGRVAVWARSRASDADEREPVRIGPDSAFVAIIPRLALSPVGSGAAIWAQGQVGALEVWANRYDGASDAWAEAERLSRTSTTTAGLIPAIAVDPNGDGFGVWAETAGTSRAVRAARLQAGAGFVGQVELASDATAETPANSPPYVAVSPQGVAIVLWDVLDEGEYELWARVFQ